MAAPPRDISTGQSFRGRGRRPATATRKRERRRTTTASAARRPTTPPPVERRRRRTPPTGKARARPTRARAGGRAESALHGLACLEGDATGGRRKGVSGATSSSGTASSCRAWEASTPPTRFVDVQLRRRARLLSVGGLRARGARHALARAVPPRGAVQAPSPGARTSRPATPGRASPRCSGRPSTPSSSSRETTIIHGDLFTIAGAGRTNPRDGHGLDLGGGRSGLKLYFDEVLHLPAGRARLPAAAGGSRAAGASPTTSPSSRGSPYGYC